MTCSLNDDPLQKKGWSLKLLPSASMGIQRAIDLATKVAIIGADEAGGKTKSDIAKE